MSEERTRMSVTSRYVDRATVIMVTGELDLAVAGEFEAALSDQALDATSGVVIDLTDLDFMDSSGLRTLLLGGDRFRVAGRPWAVVVGEDSPVRRLFALSEVEARLPLFSTPDEAIGSVKGGGG